MIKTRKGRIAGLVIASCSGGAGCTNESTRLAIETQQRANLIEQAIHERQHSGLRVLLFRDLVARLERGGKSLGAAQVAALNEAWNERDLVEFWTIQHERAKALRLIGVDSQLYSQQSIVDLLVKSIDAKLGRAIEAAAGVSGAATAQRAGG